jgi:hypothetical protein
MVALLPFSHFRPSFTPPGVRETELKKQTKEETQAEVSEENLSEAVKGSVFWDVIQ